jgi:pilus assembly protein Flp/PilA
MLSLISRFVRNDSGAAAVEYGLLVALIAGVIVLFVTNVGVNVNLAFQKVCHALFGAVTGGTDCAAAAAGT